MGQTKYGDSPLRDFMIHRTTPIAENGHYYYEMIHAKGLKLVMREKDDYSEYLYAKGSYTKRATLTYITYDKLD